VTNYNDNKHNMTDLWFWFTNSTGITQYAPQPQKDTMF